MESGRDYPKGYQYADSGTSAGMSVYIPLSELIDGPTAFLGRWGGGA